MAFPRLTVVMLCVWVTAPGSAGATETVRLKEHPELKRLYLAANDLYRAASGCAEQEDCICLHKDGVRKALERLLKVRVEHDEIINTFIEDERGVLQGAHGRGALVRISELRTIQRKLATCPDQPVAHPEMGEAPTALRAIYVAETAHYAEYNRYAPMKKAGFLDTCDVPPELGFELPGCTDGTIRYTYSIKLTDKGQGFVAEARSGAGGNNRAYPGCAPDVWTIDQDQKLLNVSGGASGCVDAKVSPKPKPAAKPK